MMESKTTSKTSCLKALLLRAWRERWSDLQWGINIKTVLPRGVSGDVYDLADCILQQAVVGSGANQLVLSYLKHSLSSQLVSHAAVLQRLAKFQQLHKTHCVASLLDFLEGILPGITCCGKSEGTKLAAALQVTTSWLLQVLQSCYGQQQLYKKALSVLREFLACPFYLAMMCLAKYVDPDNYNEIAQRCRELECGREELLDSIHILLKMDPEILSQQQNKDSGPGCLIQAWLSIQMISSPGASTHNLVQRLKLIQRLKHYTDARLYSELMRGSLMSLHDVRQTDYASLWGAFAFLKVPHLLASLADDNDSASILSAVDLLLEHSPLLDAMDAQHSCSNLDTLLGELVKLQLLSEANKQQFAARQGSGSELQLDVESSTSDITKVIICAEPTVASILKTLSTDYQNKQDALLGILLQVLTGNSFELVLAVATVQGQLRTLVQRLVRFNEVSKIGGDRARSQFFDISFLMLVAIVQSHGASAVLDGGESLLEKWVTNCMVEPNRPKSPEQLLKLCDPVTVNALLRQFNAGDADFSSVNIKWQDVLFNMAGVMKEVLIAWEQGALAPVDVKRILDAIRGRMCCLPLAAAAWLCAYMRTSPHDTLLKPVNMVRELLLSAPNVDDVSMRERWQLTCTIIKKMEKDVQLSLKPKNGGHLVSRQPAAEQLNIAWKDSINKGWVDHISARTLHCLLDTAGARWFVSSVLQELLKLRYRDQLEKGADIALAIFHVDIQSCAYQLLSNSLPQILHNTLQADSLVEPQLSTLARLTSHSVYAACCSTGEDTIDEVPTKRLRTETMEENVLDALRQLLTTLETGMQDGQISQQTYFTFELIKSIVEVRSSRSETVVTAIPATLGSQLLKTLPELFTPGILLHLHDLHTTQGRSLAARDLCVLRNYQLRNSKSNITT
ncbi:mediator of rna polymerase ii transcription subunit 24 [Holotrichia oblita]|uniref:Mediator of rna polymerase ii transcription subunit 24 n=1 Tax=Holotrichia oblita TaxID=644536 RepID=A0ACB9TWH6_HOLOL|nr:mediator of rna polymerase ii transcription subunit 24 [Holotrichia oblita]